MVKSIYGCVLRESRESREHLVVLETVDPLDLLDHLDSLVLRESLVERSENPTACLFSFTCAS